MLCDRFCIITVLELAATTPSPFPHKCFLARVEVKSSCKRPIASRSHLPSTVTWPTNGCYNLQVV